MIATKITQYCKDNFIDNNTFNNCYLLFIFIVIFLRSSWLRTNEPTYMVLLGIGFLLLLIKIYNDNWQLVEGILTASLFILFFINYKIINETGLLLTFFILIGLKHIDLRKVFHIILLVSLLSYIIIISLSLFNVIPDNIIEFARNGKLISKHALGFRNPNLLHLLLFKIIVLIVYLYYKKINLLFLSGLLLVNSVMYEFSYSRGGALAINLLIILLLCSRYKIFQNFILKLCTYIQFILFSFTILFATVLKGSSVYFFLDKALTNRLSYVANVISIDTVTLFGYNINLLDAIIDNSYAVILMKYGVVITILFLYCYYKTAKCIEKNKDMNLAILFIATSVYMFIEGFIVYAVFNYTLFFIGQYFLSNTSLKSNALRKTG